MKQEKRGIYNVTFNEKLSTPIQTDLEAIENAVIDYMVHYIKGWHNIKRDKGVGAEHIKFHLEQGSQGQITLEELLNLGNSIREYKEKFNEPFIDKEGNKTAKIYEWENNEGVRFRIATDKIKGEGLPKTPLSPSDEIIITFYSDRNLNKQMEFKNPKVTQYYQSLKNTKEAQEALRKEVKEIASKNQQKPKNREIER